VLLTEKSKLISVKLRNFFLAKKSDFVSNSAQERILLKVFFIYGIDVSIESVVKKGNFDQMRLEVENLSKKYWVFLSTKDRKSFSNLFKGKITHLSSTFLNLPDTTLGKSLAAVLFFGIGFLSFLKRAKQVGVIVSQGTASLHGALANCLFHKPVVLYLQYFAFAEQTLLGRSMLSPLFKWIEFFCIKNSTLVVAPNEKLCSEALIIGAKSVKIIPNFVNLASINEIGPKAVLRKKLGIGINENVVLFAGRLHPTKNLSLLLKSLALDKLHFCHLIVLGDGPDREQLMTLSSNLGISHRVAFKGFHPKKIVLEYMKAADVFVLPSIVEGQPRVVLEAWACGVPVVASKVAGIDNLITDGVDGLLFNLPSKEQLAASILRALEADVKEVLIVNGKEHVKQFSEERLLLEQARIVEIFLPN